MESRSESRAVIQAVSGLASSLDLTVVAEGIETFEQLQYVVKQGCSAGQGYFFAKPMPASAVLPYLSTADEELAQFAKDESYRHGADPPGQIAPRRLSGTDRTSQARYPVSTHCRN